jgi:hypothetical protein
MLDRLIHRSGTTVIGVLASMAEFERELVKVAMST